MAGSADGFWGLLSSPAGQGLLAAGLGALGGRTALGGISRGGLLGLNVYNQAKQGALDEQRMQKQDQLLDMQMQQRQQAQEQALARQNYLSSIGRVTSPVVGAQPNQFDPMKYISMGGSVEEAKNLASSGNWGKAAVKDYKEVRMPDGSVQIVGFDEFGNRQNTGAAPYKAPEFRDLGGQQVAIDPVSLKPVWSGKKSMTPGERDASARGWSNIAIERQRLAQDADGQSARGFGKAPAGYRFKPDGSLEPIPGGPADIKASLEGQKAEARKTAAIEQADRIIAKVDQAIGGVGNGWGTTGITGAALGSVPGTSAYDLRRTIETIKANLGFQELQAMREASPTGGALGQVAIQELMALQSTVANLDANQSTDRLKKSLQEARQHYANWKRAASGGATDVRREGGALPQGANGAGGVVDFRSLK